MKTEVYNAVALIVAALFSIILWFTWLGNTANFTIVSGLNTSVIWAIGVLILSLASGLIGYLTALFKTALQMPADEVDIYDALGFIVIFIFTIMVWFTFLSNPANFTIAGVIQVALLWIVVAIVISLVAVLIDYFRTKFWTLLPTPETAAKALTAKK